jgi:Carboxypeptidase regulatory-like domain
MDSRFVGFRSGFAGAFLLLLAAAVHAQTPGIGAIRGRVLDASGAPVAGAEITVTNEAAGFSRTARSDARGNYALAELPVTGTYRLRAAMAGFAPQERASIQLRAGKTAAIDVVLNPAAVAEAITVYGTAEGVQSDSPQLGDRFDATKIQ